MVMANGGRPDSNWLTAYSVPSTSWAITSSHGPFQGSRNLAFGTAYPPFGTAGAVLGTKYRLRSDIPSIARCGLANASVRARQSAWSGARIPTNSIHKARESL